MSTFREYRFTLTPHVDMTVEALARRARKVLAWACEGENRITCQGIEGEALGTVQLRFAVEAKDRWACGQVAQDLVNTVTWRLEQPAGFEVEGWHLPPHMNRGYEHGRVKRWRAQASR